jgi:nucleoside-diphosphate-sugar epimerase
LRDRINEGIDPRSGRFAGPRILVVGCGDVGRRVVALLRGRYRLLALARSPEAADQLRASGVVPITGDLDHPRTLGMLGGRAPTVLHLAPPPPHGSIDTRTRALIRALHGVERLIYVSTSGVYGDAAGAWIGETRSTDARTDRARRRVDAERQLRTWARDRGTALTILRVPGIYAGDRLPLARLNARTPVLDEHEDVYTNHIHADDLARAIVVALARGAPQRIYHTVDDSTMRMGDWFDLVADTFALDRPARVDRRTLVGQIPATLLSFMSESRRLTNARMKHELGLRLAYPTVREGLAAARHPK